MIGKFVLRDVLWKSASLIIALSIWVFILPNSSFAQELMLAREVFLEPGVVPTANVIVQTNDHGFLIAGGIKAEHQGWATRTDAEGNVQWRYTTPLIDNPGGQIFLHPEYYSSAIMSDDSSFLCGQMPRPHGEYQPGLLTHLNKEGKLLNEQLLYPQSNKNKFNARLLSCIAWDNGLLVVGDAIGFTPNQSLSDHRLPKKTDFFYWMLAFDQAGKVKWEKLYPVSSDLLGQPDELSPLQDLGGGKMFFAAARNGISTELIVLDRDGEVFRHRTIAGQFTIAQPPTPETSIKLISLITAPMTMVILNDDLDEVSRVASQHEPGTTSKAFLTSNGSMVLFGSQELRHAYFPRIMQLDATLENEKILDLSAQKDSYSVDAATPTSTSGQYACVRSVLKKSEPNKAHLGIAMDFIHTQ